MKKIMLAAVAAMTVAFAGPSVEVLVEAPVTSSAYVGLGYGFGTAELAVSDYNFMVSDSVDADNIFLQAGYNFNEYVAVEGRYAFGATYSDNLPVDTLALYLKPQYPITSELSVYGLLGYAWNEVDNTDTDFDGFAYGIGAKYAVIEDVEVFVDYTSVYSDTESFGDVDVDTDVYAVNVGVSYKF